MQGAKSSLKKSLMNLLWKPMQPLCILHWNTIISSLSINIFPPITLITEIVVTNFLSLIFMVLWQLQLIWWLQPFKWVTTFHSCQDVSRLSPSFSFPAFASCISTRPSFWFTFYFRAAGIRLQLASMCIPPSSWMCCSPCVRTASFHILLEMDVVKEQWLWGSLELHVHVWLQNRPCTMTCSFLERSIAFAFLEFTGWMKNVTKPNRISLGPDGFHAVRNADLLCLLLDVQDWS